MIQAFPSLVLGLQRIERCDFIFLIKFINVELRRQLNQLDRGHPIPS
jgi:hypothetical protein